MKGEEGYIGSLRSLDIREITEKTGFDFEVYEERYGGDEEIELEEEFKLDRWVCGA